jgi:hypothetical protein
MLAVWSMDLCRLAIPIAGSLNLVIVWYPIHLGNCVQEIENFPCHIVRYNGNLDTGNSTLVSTSKYARG